MEEEALIVKSLARGGCHVTAAKAEKTPEVGIKVKEGALTADELTEEQYQAGNMMQVNNKVEVVGGQRPEAEKQEVTTNIKVQAGETGPEKDDLERIDVKVDKKSCVTGAWRMKVWEEMYRQSEEKQSLSLKVELVDRWKPKLMSKEDGGEDEVAWLDPGDGVEVSRGQSPDR